VKAAALDRGHQEALGVVVEVGDLIEEEGVAVGLLDQARAAGGRAGEGAAFVAEQLGARELGVGTEFEQRQAWRGRSPLAGSRNVME
jgi:hypothetical protein